MALPSRFMSVLLAVDEPVEPWRPPAPRGGAPSDQPLRAELAAARAESARLRAELSRAVELADRDPLTGLYNRRAFERELSRTIASCRRYGMGAALLYLDLDGFKAVNDRRGHAAGDEVLKIVAEVLLSGVRQSDTVARLGGDEFGILLDRANRSAADIKARVLAAGIAAATHGAVGASFGIRTYEMGISPAQMLAEADAAMFVRKGERQRA